MSTIFLAQWFCPCGQCYYQKVLKTIIWLPLTKLQSKKPHRNSPEPSEPCLRYLHQHTPELSGTFRNLLPEPTPAHIRTVRNLPQPASGTYTSTHQNSPEPSGTCNLPRNLHQHTPELFRTFRNLPEPAGTYTSNTPELSGTFRNLTPAHIGTLRNHQHTPELSGTCLRNLHQHTPELSGTFRNLPPEPAPATRTGTHRSLSGLKTPLAYAVGEKNRIHSDQPSVFQQVDTRHWTPVIGTALTGGLQLHPWNVLVDDLDPASAPRLGPNGAASNIPTKDFKAAKLRN